jgi:quinoprotein glucose dehydrogenase
MLLIVLLTMPTSPAGMQAPAAALQLPDEGTKNGQWPSNHGTFQGTHYSPLDQINKDNVSKLTVAWRFKMENFGSAPEMRPQTIPIMANGTLYFTAGNKRAVVAANPGTGEILWTWVLDEGARGRTSPRPNSGRGVAYWTDGREERIVVVTPGFRLVALNAKTGHPVATFGNGGIVDMMETLGVGSAADHVGKIGSSSPPMIWNDTVIVGPALLTGLTPLSYKNTPG